MSNVGSYLVGIAGGSGSGKTTICHHLLDLLPGLATVISSDSYYRCRRHDEPSERDLINYDHPDAIEFSLLSDHLCIFGVART